MSCGKNYSTLNKYQFFILKTCSTKVNSEIHKMTILIQFNSIKIIYLAKTLDKRSLFLIDAAEILPVIYYDQIYHQIFITSRSTDVA